MGHLQQLELVLVLLGVVFALAPVARKIDVPYPIVLVVAGLVLGLLPGLPPVRLDPDLVFLVFLPPILWAAAYMMSARAFQQNFQSIRALAVGLVVATTVAVGAVAHAIFPAMGWAAAFTLGAIVSPPDAVSATAIVQRLRTPRRVLAILQGESLINDATALVIYGAAVTAVVSGTFVWTRSLEVLVYAAAAGIAIGIVVASVGLRAVRLTGEGVAQIGITLLCPYVAWVLAEHLHASSVLACVSGGLFVRPRLYRGVAPATRLQMTAVWTLLVDLLNGVVFILIGLQLGALRASLPPGIFVGMLDETMLVTLTAIVVRVAYVVGGPLLINAVLRRPPPPVKQQLVIAWTGVRGIVSIAAALALPVVTASGAAFPFRSEIILVTFGCVLLTLVVQGLPLGAIVRALRLASDAGAEGEEPLAREAVTRAALRSLGPDVGAPTGRLRDEFEGRLACIVVPGGDGCLLPATIDEQRLRVTMLRAQRVEALRLFATGQISDEVFNRLDYELDVEAIQRGLGDTREIDT
jgi:CPA1 family monovalent cation:H+ antiporter